MKRKWQTLLDTPLSREALDRSGMLVKGEMIRSSKLEEVNKELEETVMELTKQLKECSEAMEQAKKNMKWYAKQYEREPREREEMREAAAESRKLMNKLAACRQVACPMCDAWKAEVEKVNKEKDRLEKLVFQKKQVSRFASPCANSSLLYCR